MIKNLLNVKKLLNKIKKENMFVTASKTDDSNYPLPTLIILTILTYNYIKKRWKKRINIIGGFSRLLYLFF